MISVILFDIEGTTTAIDFVHRVLFPYAYEHLPEFIRQNGQHSEVTQALQSVRETLQLEESRDPDLEVQIEALLRWIREDRKHTALKALQGLIWKEGYDKQAYRAHLYPDVKPAFERWFKQGMRLGIYSSGSIFAQKLLFAHTEWGDLTPWLTAYFDTTSGPKKSTESYRTIAQSLQQPGQAILFFSDCIEELRAASQAEWNVCHVNRSERADGGYLPADLEGLCKSICGFDGLDLLSISSLQNMPVAG